MDMLLPNIWGQGQLFAFSGLDGECLHGDDLVGVLSGDRVGIRFFTATVRELAFHGISAHKPSFDAVTGDLIISTTQNGERLAAVYADTHLVVGIVPSGVLPAVMVEGAHNTTEQGNITLHTTPDGDVSALAFSDGRFAFTVGHTEADAVARAERGVTLDVDAVIENKLDYYRRVHLDISDERRLRFTRKLLSVMKTQIYSPEGRFTGLWSTPDRLPHRNLWLWDSVFHAIGARNLDPTLAERLILSVLETEDESGFIPHMATPTTRSRITQPPVIAWGALKVYEKSKNIEFLRQIFKQNAKFLEWCRINRREGEPELYTWLTSPNLNCRCDESGMDNSPRFDTSSRLYAIDFSCFMANEARAMSRIATLIGDSVGEHFYAEWYDRIKRDINEYLWCAEDGFYYDYDIDNDSLCKVRSVASFLPLLAGVCDGAAAESLTAALTDPADFAAPLAIPSIAKNDPTYGSDMWRGPVWINYNYMITEGLADYGYRTLAADIRTRTVAAVESWYYRSGTYFEFYDSENLRAPCELNRKGAPYYPYDFRVRYQSIRDYGWTGTLTFDMIINPI